MTLVIADFIQSQHKHTCRTDNCILQQGNCKQPASMASQQCEEKGLKFAGVTKVIIIAISKLLQMGHSSNIIMEHR